MAFMRADCKCPFGATPRGKLLRGAYISQSSMMHQRHAAASSSVSSRRKYCAGVLSRLAAQLGSQLPQINRAPRRARRKREVASCPQRGPKCRRTSFASAWRSPRRTRSPRRSAIEDRKAIVLPAETPAAARMIPLSSSLASRMANIVEHCESTVGSSSEGRCVTTPSEAPYLRPSLAMRPMAGPGRRLAHWRRKYSGALLRTKH